jgi:arylformamidase
MARTMPRGEIQTLRDRTRARALARYQSPLRARTPVWPGDTSFTSVPTWTISPGYPVNVSRITMSSYTGAHADAPVHYAEEGVRIGGIDLARYIGPCRVVDVRTAGKVVEPHYIANSLDGSPPRLLLRTHERAPLEAWDSGFASVAPDTIKLAAYRGILLIGTDTPSLDPETSKSMDAHRAIFAHGMSILRAWCWTRSRPATLN